MKDFLNYKKLFNKFGIVVMGCTLATTPLAAMTNEKNMIKVKLIIVIFYCFICVLNAQDKSYKIIIDVRNNRIYFDNYIYDKTYDVDVSDLELIPKILNEEKVYNIFYKNYSAEDFRKLLLKNGFAKLKDTTNAIKQEKDAQSYALKNNYGMWKKAEPQQQTDSIKQKFTEQDFDWTIWGIKIWNIILVLGSLGILSFLFNILYKKLIIEKKISLLIVGLPSTGKTAFFKRLKNPKISAFELLQTSPSSIYETSKRANIIRRAKFEIYPHMGDTPGSRPDIILDQVTSSKHTSLVVLLSPFQTNGFENNTVGKLDLDKNSDQKYMYEQLGYIKGLIKGILRASVTNKPKVVILFINKFDLISDYPENDSNSLQLSNRLKQLFSDHIKEIKITCDSLKIPFEVIIGSPVKNWNVEETLDIVVDKLYS